MKGKCEICEETAELIKVSACACDENSLHAFICKKCKKKYFDYPKIPSVFYIPNRSYAENLVYAYKERFERSREPHKKYTGQTLAKKKEAPTMKVEYNGFSGELVKLERKDLRVFGVEGSAYSLVIEDKEKHVKHDFDNVKLEGIKFLGSAVSFGG